MSSEVLSQKKFVLTDTRHHCIFSSLVALEAQFLYPLFSSTYHFFSSNTVAYITLIFGYICSSSLAQSTETSSYYQSPLDSSPPFTSYRKANAFCFGIMSVNQEDSPTALFNGCKISA